MKFSTLSKAGFAAAMCASLTGVPTGAIAGTLQDTIFAKVEPSVRDRMFFRLSYVNAGVKVTSKDAYDVTGPVLAKGDVGKYLGTGSSYTSGFVTGSASSTTPLPKSQYYLAGYLLDSQMDTQAAEDEANGQACASVANGLGTPCGIKVKSAAHLGTMALSIGYFLDESYSWAVEAFVLAAPLNAKVYGDGNNHLNGHEIITTKMLPPIATLGRYFGSAKDAFRPYLGVAGSYAIFFDTKATDYLNAYQGGANPGDTTIKISNSFGFGPMLGFQLGGDDADGWYARFAVGKLRYKTETTLVTRNTTITSNSLVLQDFGADVVQAIEGGAAIFSGTRQLYATATSPGNYAAGTAVNFTDALMCDIAKYKTGNSDCNFGTFVRKASNVLDSTLFMFSVGRSF